VTVDPRDRSLLARPFIQIAKTWPSEKLTANVHSKLKAHLVNLATESRRINAMQRKYLFAGLLLLSSTLASNGAMADLNDRSASTFGQSAPATQESNADSDQRFLALFRAASLSLTQAIASAERLHAVHGQPRLPSIYRAPRPIG
jgi:hypothetical protein